MLTKWKFRVLKLASVFLLLSIVMPSVAYAAISPSAFAEPYTPAATLSPLQSRVIFYRLGTPEDKAAAAFIYVDRAFHGALLPGGFTEFCLDPGTHMLGAVQNDAPYYAHKQQQPWLDLKAGRSLFLRVNELGDGAAQPVSQEVARQELAGSRRQAHLFSRVPTIQTCKAGQPITTRSFSLSSDALFAFGRSSYQDISQQARDEVSELARRLLADIDTTAALEVVGHTDRIGRAAANDAVGMRRAQSIRQLLVENGISPERITARSAGDREPVTGRCEGSRAAQIACYAPDRRVVVHVQIQENH